MRSLQKNNRRRVPKDSLRSVSKEFAEATSMHGLKFISQDDASLPERFIYLFCISLSKLTQLNLVLSLQTCRILWVVLFCVGFFFAVGFSWKLWDNWQNSPVLITIQSANYPVLINQKTNKLDPVNINLHLYLSRLASIPFRPLLSAVSTKSQPERSRRGYRHSN